MPHFEVETPPTPSYFSPFPSPGSTAALVALSRNASVISSSSGSSSSSSLLLNTVRPRPLRTFSSPRNRSLSGGTSTPRARIPLYVSKEPLAEKATEKSTGSSVNHTRRVVSKSRKNSSASRLGPDDFEFGEILGEGSYSTVMAAIYPPTQKVYAIKIIDKEPLVRRNLVWVANTEKDVLVKLSRVGHPGIVRLYWTFQDEWSWYFVLDMLSQGDLQSRISHLGSICSPCARWYMAQIIDAVSWMHSRGVIHRDLKPQNVLLDNHMMIKITDFGSAKVFEEGKEDDISNSWVGTPQYVPPELLLRNAISKSSDYWAIGCILYQMISGKFPFQGTSTYLMWVKVKTLDYAFPDAFDDIARDLVQKILILDPNARLGAGEPGTPNDLSVLRSHPFFNLIPWDRLWTDPVPPLEAGYMKNNDLSTASGQPSTVQRPQIETIGNIQSYGVSEFNADAHETIESVHRGISSLDRSKIFSDSYPSSPTKSSSLGNRDTLLSHGDSTPIESHAGRLGGMLGTLTLTSRSRRPSTTSHSLTALTNPTLWMPFLRPSETPVFFSCVYKVARRAFPRQLFPLTGNIKKGLSLQGKEANKLRLLVLTKTRLLCFKEQDGEAIVKSEMLIGGQGGGVGVVTGVERVDHGFVVQTISKSYTYTTEDCALASRWAKEIAGAIPATLTYNELTERTKLAQVAD